MLNCSGHLMSTAQVESVLVEHKMVAEAAVSQEVRQPAVGRAAVASVLLLLLRLLSFLSVLLESASVASLSAAAVAAPVVVFARRLYRVLLESASVASLSAAL